MSKNFAKSPKKKRDESKLMVILYVSFPFEVFFTPGSRIQAGNDGIPKKVCQEEVCRLDLGRLFDILIQDDVGVF
jgi:hypothetical protein